MADDKMLTDSGAFRGVNVYAPFALAMEMLRGEFAADSGFAKEFKEIMSDTPWPIELKKSENGSMIKLYNNALNKFVPWADLYILMESYPPIDTAFKRFLNASKAVAEVNDVYERTGTYWALTERCMNYQGFISEKDVYELSEALITHWMLPEMTQEGKLDRTLVKTEFQSFLSFAYLISNRMVNEMYTNRPVNNDMANIFNRWYIWPSLGLFNGVNQIIEKYSRSKDIVWGALTMNRIQELSSVGQFPNQVVADQTLMQILKMEKRPLEENMEARSMSELFDNIDFMGMIVDIDAYKKVVAVALKFMYEEANQNAIEFVDAIFDQGGTISSVQITPQKDNMVMIQDLLSKSIFLDNQDRAEFVKNEIGNLEMLKTLIGDEQAVLIWDILDDLSTEEKARLGTAKKASKSKPKAESKPSEFEGCEMVVDDELDTEVKGDDLEDINELLDLDDLLEDIFEEGELEDLLDLDLELDD